MVEIIPKPTKKSPLWQDTLLYFSIVVLLIVVAAYFILGYFISEKEQVLKEKENILAQTVTAENKELEIKIFQQKKKIDNFANFINQHKISSDFFDLLEEITHPQVWFSQIDLDVMQATVKLSGEADKTALGQQLIIFRETKQILESELSGIQIKEGETVSFTIPLSLDPGIFKFLK